MPAMSSRFQRLGWVLSIAAACCVGAVVNRSYAAVIYVKAGLMTGNHDGTSWANAFRFLQDALAVAQSGDQVWVGIGTYRPDQRTGNEGGTLLQNEHFALVSGVAMYGGFVGFEVSPAQRMLPTAGQMLTTPRSILSGDFAGDDDLHGPLNDYNAHQPDGMTVPEYELNAHSVVGAPGDPAVNSNTILDGFTIRGARTRGGLNITTVDSSPIIRNCFFYRNWGKWPAGTGAGAHVAGAGTNVEFSRCMFYDNMSAAAGDGSTPCAGGLAVFNRSHSTVRNCKFVGNVAFGGNSGSGAAGGIRVVRSSPLDGESATITVVNTLFLNNLGAGSGGHGGIGFHLSSGDVRNCTFFQNQSQAEGGGGVVVGNGSNGHATVVNCLFWRNVGLGNIGWDISGVNYTISHSFTTNEWVPFNSTTQSLGGLVNGGAPPSGANNWTALNFYSGQSQNQWDYGIDGIPGNLDDGFQIMSPSICSDAGNSLAAPSSLFDLDGSGPIDLNEHPRFTDDPVVADSGTQGVPNQEGFKIDIGAYEVQRVDGDRTWVTAVDGLFGEQTKWWPWDPPGVPRPPAPPETGLFDKPTSPLNTGSHPRPYSVQLNTDVQFGRLLIRRGDVTFDVAGHDMNLVLLNFPPAITVGRFAGDSGELSLVNLLRGSTSVITNHAAHIGADAGSSGAISIVGGNRNGNNIDWRMLGDLVVGGNGYGSLEVSDGAVVTSGDGFIAQTPGSSGHALITGSGSRWIINFMLRIGNTSPTAGTAGTLTVHESAIIRAGPPFLPIVGVFIYPNGVLQGDGTVDAIVANFGTIDPESSNFDSFQLVGGTPLPDTLTINGDLFQIGETFNQGPRSGRVVIDVVAVGRSVANDTLDVFRSAFLGGSLIINLDPSVANPDQLPALEVLTASSIGQGPNFRYFDVAVLPPIANNKYMKVCYDQCNQQLGTTSVSLTIEDLNSLFGFGTAGPETVVGIPSNAVRGDFNNDGFDDLAIAVPEAGDIPGAVLVCINAKDGTFTTTPHTVGIDPRDVVIGSFDADPGIDLAVVNAGPASGLNAGSVHVLFNDGDGGFGSRTPSIISNIADHPQGLAAGNFNTAGLDDLIVTDSGTPGNPGNAVRPLMNQGGPTPTFLLLPPIIVNPHPIRVRPGSVDLDRNLDFFVLCRPADGASSGTVTAHENNPASPGTFLPSESLAVGPGPNELEVHTLDQQDLRTDIVTINSDGTVSIIISQDSAQSGFAPAVNLSVGSGGATLQSIELSNLDAPSSGDLDIDVAVLMVDGSSGQGVIQVLRNDSDPGEPLALTQMPPTAPLMGDPRIILAGAFDGDPQDPDNGNDLLTVNESSTLAASGGSSGGSGGSGGGGSVQVLPLTNPNRVPQCLGDVGPQPGGNGLVNIDDLVLVIVNWGAMGSNVQADVNHDTVVNIDDLVALITNWGPCP